MLLFFFLLSVSLFLFNLPTTIEALLYTTVLDMQAPHPRGQICNLILLKLYKVRMGFFCFLIFMSWGIFFCCCLFFSSYYDCSNNLLILASTDYYITCSAAVVTTYAVTSVMRELSLMRFLTFLGFVFFFSSRVTLSCLFYKC